VCDAGDDTDSRLIRLTSPAIAYNSGMKKSNPSSTVSHKAAGRKASLVWLDPAQHEAIKEAARIEQRSVTAFLSFHAMSAAQKILKKSGNVT